MAWTCSIGGASVHGLIRPFTSLKVTNRGYSGVGTFSARLVEQGPTYSLAISNEMPISLLDGAVPIFAGYVRKRNMKDFNTQNIRVWEIEGQDYNTDPGDDWVPVGTGPRTITESDKARIEWLFTTYGTRGVLAVGQSTVQTIQGALPNQDFQMMTLAEAMDAICGLTGAQWYVDFNHILHYFVNEVTTAPFNIDVQAPNNSTTFPCKDFEYPDDTIDYVNEVQVVGYGVNSTRWRGGVAPAPGNKRLKILRDTNLLDVAACNAAGDAYLALENNKNNGKLTVWRPGLRAGQLVHIKNTMYSIDADFRIAEVSPRFLDQSQAFYDIAFGGNPVRMSDLWQKQAGSIADVGRSSDNALNYASQFGGRIKVVSSLPTLPNATYPIGMQVFLTTDEKTYRNPDDVAWTASIWLPDGLGEIGTTQIADDAISAPKIAAGSVAAESIQAGAITSLAIAADAIQAGHIEAGAIGAEALAAQIILADTLIATGVVGQRVEIDDSGLRAFDASNKRIVNISAVAGEGAEFVGRVEASTLIANDSAELRGQNILNAGSQTTLMFGVVNPTTAPGVIVSTPSQTLGTAPAQPSAGLCYDPSGSAAGGVPTYWIGADPTIGNGKDMAYEYAAATGALLRTLQLHNTNSTATTTVGSTSHVADTTDAATGATTSQIGTPIVMPSHPNMKITKVHAYLAGYGGSAVCHMAVWNTSGTILSEGGNFTAASKTFSNGNDNAYETTVPALAVASGGTYWCGFLHTSSADGFFWSKDDGSGKTTKKGDGLAGSMTSIATDTDSKPNVYVTITYDVGSTVEGTVGKIIGVVRQGTFIWVLDSNGVLFKYNQADLSYVGQYNLSAQILGTKANAGLMWDGINLNITTASGVTGSDLFRMVGVNTSGAFVSAANWTGLTVNGSTGVFRGGYYDGSVWWMLVNGVVQAFSGGAYVANRDFGEAEGLEGICYNTTFIGWDAAQSTKLWLYTTWDWTTECSPAGLYGISYTWYDNVAPVHETGASPSVFPTIGRRRQVQISNPAIPTGGTEPPTRVRVYMWRNSGATRIAEDALTTRLITGFTSTATSPPGANNFPAGTPAILQSSAAGWSLKGDGAAAFTNVTALTSPGEAWIPMTLVAAWVNYGSGFEAAAYRKDAQGRVHLRGLIKSGVVPSTIFTFPVGYRPGGGQLILNTLSNNLVGRVDITTAGVLSASAPSVSAWINLTGLFWLAEA